MLLKDGVSGWLQSWTVASSRDIVGNTTLISHRFFQIQSICKRASSQTSFTKRMVKLNWMIVCNPRLLLNKVFGKGSS